MLESKQHAHFRYFLDFDTATPVNDRIKKSLVDLIHLFCPEDTTDSLDYRSKNMLVPVENRTRSILKMVVLVAVSIALSLLISQLGN